MGSLSSYTDGLATQSNIGVNFLCNDFLGFLSLCNVLEDKLVSFNICISQDQPHAEEVSKRSQASKGNIPQKQLRALHLSQQL